MNSNNSIIKAIFANKLDVDDRSPILSVTLGGHEWGLYPPHILFWVQLLVGIVLFVTFTATMASITYYVIIPRKRSPIAFLVGFGFIIPACILFVPFWVLDALDVRNKLLRFAMCAIYPVLTMFHTSEAIFGYSPHSVESSYKNYILYYVAAVETQFDTVTNQPIMATWDDKMQSLKSFGFWLGTLGMYKSIFCISGYEPFQTTADGNDPSYNLGDIFDINLLRNNVLATMLLQLYLSAFISALFTLVTIILRVKVKDGMMDNPLLKASSPSNFWSGRWNLVIHGALKRGVFKPVYNLSSSKLVAILVTFLASGLFHEFILIATHPPHLNFQHTFGKNTAFMMWNAAVIILEAVFGKAPIFAWIKTNLPKPLVTMMVICTAMPLAHWFLHPYTKSNLFVIDGQVAMPMIKMMN